MAAPVVASSNIVHVTTANTNLTLTPPSGTVSGDVLVAFVYIDVDTATISTVGTGYTLINGPQNGGNADERVYSYYKILTATEGNTSWAISTARQWSMSVHRITGADTTNPLDVANSGSGSAANSTLQPMPAITTVADECLVLSMICSDRSGSYTPPALTPPSTPTFTEIYDTSNTGSVMAIGVASATKSPAGAVGTADWTMNASDRAALISVAIKPPSGPSTQTVTCQALTTTSSVLTPNVQYLQTVSCNVLTTTSTIFSPTVEQVISLEVVATTSTILNPTLDYNVNLAVLATTSSILNPTIVPGAVSIVVPLIATTSTVLDAGAEAIIQLDVMGTTSTIFNPSLNYDVVLNVVSVPGSVLSPGLAQKTEFQVLATTSTIYGPELNQDVILPVINAPETVLSPSVPTAGAQTINYEVLNTTSTIFSPRVYETIVVPVLNVPGTVESPSTKYSIGLQVVSTSSSIFTPSLEYLIELQTVNTAPTVLAPLIGEPPPDTGQYGIVKTNSPSPFPIGI